MFPWFERSSSAQAECRVLFPEHPASCQCRAFVPVIFSIFEFHKKGSIYTECRALLPENIEQIPQHRALSCQFFVFLGFKSSGLEYTECRVLLQHTLTHCNTECRVLLPEYSSVEAGSAI